MRMAIRKRWYCDHCRKSMGTEPGMARHEKGCTNNPGRVCNHCSAMGEVQLPIHERCEIFIESGWDALVEAVNNCPLCLLSTVRITNRYATYDDYTSEPAGWDFKVALKQFWKEIDEADPRPY